MRFWWILGTVLSILLIAVIAVAPGWQEHPGAAEAESGAEEKVLHLRFGHNTPVDSALHEAALRYARLVSERSGGRVEITVYPAQELGNDHQMVEMAREGSLDIILTPTAKMSVAVPAMQYADLPFFFPNPEDVYTMLDGEPGRMLLEKLNTIGLVGVTFWENGFKHFSANEPLLRLEDFKNKTFRVMKSRIIFEQFKELGAKSVPIDFYATRKALEDGVVDGQENPLVAFVSMGFHEVQKHLTLSSHAYLGYVFSISARALKELPPDVQSLLVETAREVTPWERQATREREAKLIETIKAAGVEVDVLEPAERARMAAVMADIPGKFESVIGADIISKTQELLLEKYGPAPQRREQIVVGLDADLSMGGHVSGLAIKRGMELAVREINARGGVLGKPLVLIARDHRGIASRGVENLRQLVAREDTVAVMGGQHSAVILAERELVNAAALPYLVPWAANARITDDAPCYFRVSANDRDAAPFILREALRLYKKPALIVENSVWGRDNLSQMKQMMASEGSAFAAVATINRGQQSYDADVDALMASGADSVILIANALEGGAVLRRIAAYRSPLPVVSHWGITGGEIFERDSDTLQRVPLRFFQTFSFRDAARPKARNLAEAYMRRYGVESVAKIAAPGGVAQAYDEVMMLAAAIEKAGTTERSAVCTALETIGAYDGAVRKYERPFAPGRHDALDAGDYFMARFDENGAIIPLR